MRVEVLQEHIEQGVRRNSGCCPIALALRDAGCQEVSVDTDEVHINGLTYVFDEAGEAEQFVIDFDNGKTVTPKVLHLCVPEGELELEYDDGV